jgi:hypothetical protein
VTPVESPAGISGSAVNSRCRNMKVDRNDTLAGFPLIKIRDLLRPFRPGTISSEDVERSWVSQMPKPRPFCKQWSTRVFLSRLARHLADQIRISL